MLVRQIGESEVRVADRIVGRQLSQLFEFSFGLGELVPLQISDTKHSSGVQLLD